MGGILSKPALLSCIQVLPTRHRLPTSTTNFVLRPGAAEMTCATNILRLLALLKTRFFTTKEGGGLRMGLSISRTIVESHGGRIWVTANEPHGARFWVHLPAAGARD